MPTVALSIQTENAGAILVKTETSLPLQQVENVEEFLHADKNLQCYNENDQKNQDVDQTASKYCKISEDSANDDDDMHEHE